MPNRLAAAGLGLLCLAASVHAAADDVQTGKPSELVEFILIDGGKFAMGTDQGAKNAAPIHAVSVGNFEMSRTLVTVEQYAKCVALGKCARPDAGSYCNWGRQDRRSHPVNCVSWKDAVDFAKFQDSRLPSEAEYEYAATGRGKNKPYPWGKDAATCEKTVMYGCAGDGTLPVCSKPKGSTEQGLCDMTGNVWEWVQDTWHDSYSGAPADGRAWENEASLRVMRGGSFLSKEADFLRADYRFSGDPSQRYGSVGFRLARSRR